jgi:hypothetical protein
MTDDPSYVVDCAELNGDGLVRRILETDVRLKLRQAQVSDRSRANQAIVDKETASEYAD